mmetsp:Transcript_12232/g.26424  ORF Transcript_12232/g.26424 Transcript_12232/m.26424 type:complete len:233 (+) Transcript_12232:279-977(+)
MTNGGLAQTAFAQFFRPAIHLEYTCVRRAAPKKPAAHYILVREYHSKGSRARVWTPGYLSGAISPARLLVPPVLPPCRRRPFGNVRASLALVPHRQQIRCCRPRPLRRHRRHRQHGYPQRRHRRRRRRLYHSPSRPHRHRRQRLDSHRPLRPSLHPPRHLAHSRRRRPPPRPPRRRRRRRRANSAHACRRQVPTDSARSARARTSAPRTCLCLRELKLQTRSYDRPQGKASP